MSEYYQRYYRATVDHEEELHRLISIANTAYILGDFLVAKNALELLVLNLPRKVKDKIRDKVVELRRQYEEAMQRVESEAKNITQNNDVLTGYGYARNRTQELLDKYVRALLELIINALDENGLLIRGKSTLVRQYVPGKTG